MVDESIGIRGPSHRLVGVHAKCVRKIGSGLITFYKAHVQSRTDSTLHELVSVPNGAVLEPFADRRNEHFIARMKMSHGAAAVPQRRIFSVFPDRFWTNAVE